MGPVCCRT